MPRLKEIRRYLSGNGWVEVPYTDKLVKIKKCVEYQCQECKTVEKEDIEIIIPNTEDIPDYAPRIVDLMKSLASIEGREIADVLKDVGFLEVSDDDSLRVEIKRLSDQVYRLTDFAIKSHENRATQEDLGELYDFIRGK